MNHRLFNKYKNVDYHYIIILSMLLVFAKIVCNPLFFRNIEIRMPFMGYAFKCTASAVTFPLIFIVIDAITMLSSRRAAIKIMAVGILCDGLFSYFVTEIAMFDYGAISPVIILGQDMWTLFLHGLIGTCIASLFEIILFSYFFQKVKSFLFSTIISISTMLIVHNVITDYHIMREDYDRSMVILSNTLCEILIMLGYVLMVMVFIKVIKFKYIWWKK